MGIFNEEKLGEEIKKQWGEYGAHYELFKSQQKRIEELLKSHSDWMTLALERKDVIVDQQKRIEELVAENSKLKDDLGDKSVDTYFKLSKENTELRDYIKMVYTSVTGGGYIVTFNDNDIKKMKQLLNKN